MHDIGTIVWVILIVIGVVSSIVKRAREGGKAVRPIQQRPAAAVHPPLAGVAAAPPPPPVPAATVEPPLVVVRAAPPRAAAPKVAPSPLPAFTDGTGRFRGMFQRGSLVRAIVAAEVLGPPKALQERSIWSPPHSEPST